MAKLNPKDKLFGKSDPASPKPKRGRGRPKSEIPMDKFTYYLPEELAEEIASYAYWARIPVSVALVRAWKAFAKKQPTELLQPRPDVESVADAMKGGK